MPMCRRGTLARNSCTSGYAIPQPMPLPQVPVGVLSLSNVCLLSRIIFGYSLPLHLTLYTKKIAPKCDFSCIYQKNTLPLHRIQCKGSRWESCTVPLLWFAIRCSNSYKSLVLIELGRLNRRSDKSEDLLRAAESLWFKIVQNRSEGSALFFLVLTILNAKRWTTLNNIEHEVLRSWTLSGNRANDNDAKVFNSIYGTLVRV